MNQKRGGAKYSKNKYEDRLKDEINLMLRQSLSDPRLTFVSVTHVELTNDFSQAKVYWDTFDAEKKHEISKSLSRVAGHLKSELAKKMEVRQIPDLKMIYNSQFEDEQKITELLKTNNNSNE